MKIRRGFVSNSSSTSFYMIVKGSSMEDVFSMIEKYGDYFKLSYVNSNGRILKCDYADIIRELKGVGKPSFYKLDKFIKGIAVQIKYGEECLIIEKLSGNNDRVLDSYKREIIDDESKKFTFLGAKRKGFTHLLIVGFGDNDGEISGGSIGTTMDYEGRQININAEDFIVFTEQNR